jgi:predicted RNA-binding protein YlxR (DUF448 family)
MKKQPLRMCVVCRERKNKPELTRIVSNAEKGVCVDVSGKMNGRGAYICHDCCRRDDAKVKKALEAALKHAVSDEEFTMIQKTIRERLNDEI